MSVLLLFLIMYITENNAKYVGYDFIYKFLVDMQVFLFHTQVFANRNAQGTIY